jgi:hypothetical protein
VYINRICQHLQPNEAAMWILGSYNLRNSSEKSDKMPTHCENLPPNFTHVSIYSLSYITVPKKLRALIIATFVPEKKEDEEWMTHC